MPLPVSRAFIISPQPCTQSLTSRLPFRRMFSVPFQDGDPMSDSVGIAGDRIRSFVERIEHLEAELQEINE